MDAAPHHSRWHPPFEEFKPAYPGELTTAVAILGHIRRRPILPTSYVAAFLETSQYHYRILRKLHRARLICWHDESENRRNANYRDMLWSITKKGDRFYMKHGGTEPHRNLNSAFRHASGCSIVGALFDLAAQHYELAITYHETRAPNYDGLVPDEPPFSLRGDREIDFAGFEFDRNTMPLKSEIAAKLVKYERYFLNRRYEQHCLKTAFVPIVTTNETHMSNLMALVEAKVTPRLHSRFLCKAIPELRNCEIPPATGHIISESWHRIGGSFNILEALGWTSRSSKTSSESGRLSIARSAM